MQKIESERIINMGEYEALISKVRLYMGALKRHLENKDYEDSIYTAAQIDLVLHQMEAYEFQIERRTIIALCDKKVVAEVCRGNEKRDAWTV